MVDETALEGQENAPRFMSRTNDQLRRKLEATGDEFRGGTQHGQTFFHLVAEFSHGEGQQQLAP